MTRSGKRSLWKFLILGMVCLIIAGGSFMLLSFSKPTQEVSCTPCHTAAGEPGAAPLTIFVNTTYVEVQPSSTFSLEVSASGGELDHMMVKFPIDEAVANNSLFTYSPREIYDGDDGSLDGNVSSTPVSITSPATQGLYTIRVFAATSAYGSYDRTATYADISVNVTAPPPPINEPPVASFTESATTVYTGEVITFDASASYDPDGAIVSYEWDFGDGTTGTGVTTSHSYADDGTYTVNLTVTDNLGTTNNATATKTVLNRAPTANFTESATTVLVGETITFDASGSSDPDGTIVSYVWDFGDGSTATGVTTSHAYTDAGTYTVTLTVTDDDDATATTSATKTVLSPPPQEASAQLMGVGRKPGSILPGKNVTLKARVKNTGTADVAFYVKFVIKNPAGDAVGMVNTTEAVEYVGDGPLWVSTPWQVPVDAIAGTYTVEATLYYKAVGAETYTTGNTLTLTFKVRNP